MNNFDTAIQELKETVDKICGDYGLVKSPEIARTVIALLAGSPKLRDKVGRLVLVLLEESAEFDVYASTKNNLWRVLNARSIFIPPREFDKVISYLTITEQIVFWNGEWKPATHEILQAKKHLAAINRYSKALIKGDTSAREKLEELISKIS